MVNQMLDKSLEIIIKIFSSIVFCWCSHLMSSLNSIWLNLDGFVTLKCMCRFRFLINKNPLKTFDDIQWKLFEINSFVHCYSSIVANVRFLMFNNTFKSVDVLNFSQKKIEIFSTNLNTMNVFIAFHNHLRYSVNLTVVYDSFTQTKWYQAHQSKTQNNEQCYLLLEIGIEK